MNREIKFRAWDGNKMSEPFSWYNINCDDDAVYCGNCRLTLAPFEKLMQYTGLQDKNGKEIYEGDILEFGLTYKDKTVVTFEKGCFMHSTNVLFIGHDRMEVIGNIYEHGDLLK